MARLNALADLERRSFADAAAVFLGRAGPAPARGPGAELARLTLEHLSLVLVSLGTEVVGTRIWSLYASGGFDELAAFGVVTLGAVLALALATVLVGRVATRRIRALD